MTLRAANGSVIPVSGKAEFRIGLDKHTFISEVWVAAIDVEAIIGLDFLRDNQCIVDVVGHTIKVGSSVGQCSSDRVVTELKCCRVYLDSTLVIPPGREVLTTGKVEAATDVGDF